jgi:hypothetical protein
MKESKLHIGKSECGSKFKTCFPVQWRKVQSCRKIENLFKSLLGRDLNPYASYLKRSSAGFTSIELIVVVLCLAILAGTAVVSFRLSDEDKSTIAADQLIADIQYVQMRAMGIGKPGNQQNILFAPGMSSYSICEGASVVERKNLPDGVAIQNTTFPGHTLVFNNLGEPTFGTSDGYVYLGKGGSTFRTLQVFAVTGKTQ